MKYWLAKVDDLCESRQGCGVGQCANDVRRPDAETEVCENRENRQKPVENRQKPNENLKTHLEKPTDENRSVSPVNRAVLCENRSVSSVFDIAKTKRFYRETERFQR